MLYMHIHRNLVHFFSCDLNNSFFVLQFWFKTGLCFSIIKTVWLLKWNNLLHFYQQHTNKSCMIWFGNENNGKILSASYNTLASETQFETPFFTIIWAEYIIIYSESVFTYKNFLYGFLERFSINFYLNSKKKLLWRMTQYLVLHCHLMW